MALGRVVGPVNCEAGPQLQVNRFGVIPKPHQPGKWRLIVDLSHPRGSSVNDGIEPELCSLKYTSVDKAVQMILEMGAGTKLAKFDVEGAYRTVPVHPDDRGLLGMRWKGKTYIDTVLPFGLRSAPKIFTAIADAMQWIMRRAGARAIHYLDDFLLFGPPGSDECDRALAGALDMCGRLGVPIASHKTEGPTAAITFLGIELDCITLVARLPEDKLKRLRREIRNWSTRKSCTKKDLLSLIGQLQHACCVVRPGRTFLRRMIELSTVVKENHHHIRLNSGFRSDLQWWARFLTKWNGSSMMSRANRSRWDVTMTSDASGSWGAGAYTSYGDWLQLRWPQSWESVHITVKELLPIVMGAAIWGRHWEGKMIRCRCDNAATVAIVNSGRSKVVRAMHLMRSLFFFLASYDITLYAEHIRGVDNGAADALSRDNCSEFFMQVPRARQEPSVIPPAMSQVLLVQQPDWTSVSWTDLLATTL